MAIIVTGEISTAIKKVFKNKALVENPGNAADLIQLDPAISGITGIVFSPEVLAGRNGEILISALERRHPNVVAIIVYKDPRVLENPKIQRVPDLYPIQLAKFVGTPELETAINNAINNAVQRGQNSNLLFRIVPDYGEFEYWRVHKICEWLDDSADSTLYTIFSCKQRTEEYVNF